jgi:hypothetical protein
MEVKKQRRYNKDYIEINVGGAFFSCSKTTLTSFSSYFQARLSAEWYACEETLYVDQDPDAFQVLLSFMRYGFIKASSVTEMVLIQADFLGIDLLLNAIKCSAYRHLHNFESQSLDEDETCNRFHYKYGGIMSAIRKGILPKQIKTSTKGYKEYMHLYVRSQNVISPRLLPYPLPCLLCHLIGPNDHLEKQTVENPFPYATLLDGINWMHKHGFVMTEERFGHNTCDFDSEEPISDHIWFSRTSDGENFNSCWESPILFDADEENVQAESYRKQFAALVSNDRDGFVMADIGERQNFHVFDSNDFEQGSVPVLSRTSCILENPVSWLGKQGYLKEEKIIGRLYEEMFRQGIAKTLMCNESDLKRVHVSVFSRKLIVDPEGPSAFTLD